MYIIYRCHDQLKQHDCQLYHYERLNISLSFAVNEICKGKRGVQTEIGDQNQICQSYKLLTQSMLFYSNSPKLQYPKQIFQVILTI